MPALISASRRTDIPRFYARWFSNRRRAGFAVFRNSFGIGGRVSLRDEDVLGYLFWTRDAVPLLDELASLRAAGLPYAFQYTITDYGRDLEPRHVEADHAVETVRRVVADMPGVGGVQWRYDPIVLTNRYDPTFHLRSFERLAEALEGVVRVVNTSIVEPYHRVVRRLGTDEVLYRRLDAKRHGRVAALHPDLRSAGEEVDRLAEEMADLARRHGMELRACANPDLPLPPAQCCSAELFAPWGSAVIDRIAALDRAPSRGACRCLRSVDIGMDNTCPAGCRYCYALISADSARRNAARHDPESPSIR